jgi:hypothetical protein
MSNPTLSDSPSPPLAVSASSSSPTSAFSLKLRHRLKAGGGPFREERGGPVTADGSVDVERDVSRVGSVWRLVSGIEGWCAAV